MHAVRRFGTPIARHGGANVAQIAPSHEVAVYNGELRTFDFGMRFPALFIGHGSPMNAIVSSKSTETWAQLASQLPKPEAILVISAHWEESALKVQAAAQPKQIYDMYNFPDELYQLKYPAPGSPHLAKRVVSLLSDYPVEETEDWGLDHGAWSILNHMYPEADVPVVQLSLDRRQSEQWHFEVGKKLAPLRDENVLILASGSIVHNLSLRGQQTPLPFSLEWNDFVDANVNARVEPSKHPLVHYKEHPVASKAIPDPEHYQPLLYLLGLLDANKEDKLETFLKDQWNGGTIGMMSYRLSEVPVHGEL